MKSRTYYGEYSLKHWISMMLSKKIVLPEYQRSFVWDVRDIKRLIKSFQNGQFVQPVTIGLYSNGDDNDTNLILDGQQRLTSLILANIGYAPDLNKFEAAASLASDDDSVDSDSESRGPVKWTFENLLVDNIHNNTIEKIRERVSSDERYVKIKIDGLDSTDEEDSMSNFLTNTFLGFSYIVPNSQVGKEIQNGYTRLFRNMNFFGKRLSVLESRRSLYYTNVDFKYFFEGLINPEVDVLCGLTIQEKMVNTRIDFVRYLAILSQYVICDGDIKQVLKWYSAYSSREAYYADYVSFILGLEQEEHIEKFDSFKFTKVFPNSCWKERYVKLNSEVKKLKKDFELDKNNSFKSWIDVDYWFFGLIYQVVFKGKGLIENITPLTSEISKAIQRKKDDIGYSKSPNRLGNVRDRLKESIEIYSKYVY